MFYFGDAIRRAVIYEIVADLFHKRNFIYNCT